MNNSKKNAIYGLVLLLTIIFVYQWRKQNTPILIEFSGKTMGTSYTIKYLSQKGISHQSQIDSLLQVFNQSLSTYIPTSEISTFNTSDSVFVFKLPYFYPVLEKSKEVFEKTNAAFDPTVMPLVNAWGFGPSKMDSLPTSQVDSLKQLIGFQYIAFDKIQVRKLKKNFQLDFSAIAKGYGVDVVADFLTKQGINDMLVEIGGEVVCKGKNQKGEFWAISIDDPQQSQERRAIVRIDNQALATSGNYRNFYEKDGKKYAHTISPQTGFPIQHSLLSASVFAKDCMSADAYATAFMVLGKEKAIEIAQKEGLEIFLVFEEDGKIKTYSSPKISTSITQ